MLLRPFALMVSMAMHCGTSLVSLWSHNFSMPALHGGDILKPMKETESKGDQGRNLLKADKFLSVSSPNIDRFSKKKFSQAHSVEICNKVVTKYTTRP